MGVELEAEPEQPLPQWCLLVSSAPGRVLGTVFGKSGAREEIKKGPARGVGGQLAIDGNARISLAFCMGSSDNMFPFPLLPSPHPKHIMHTRVGVYTHTHAHAAGVLRLT